MMKESLWSVIKDFIVPLICAGIAIIPFILKAMNKKPKLKFANLRRDNSGKKPCIVVLNEGECAAYDVIFYSDDNIQLDDSGKKIPRKIGSLLPKDSKCFPYEICGHHHRTKIIYSFRDKNGEMYHDSFDLDI
jgi:hypothetical protein